MLSLPSPSPANLEKAQQAAKKIIANPPSWLHLAQSDISEAKHAGEKLAKRFDRLVILGIGGSALGAEMLRDFFGLSTNKLTVLDNLDPAFLEAKMKEIDLKNTAFAVISKSGGTTETIVQYFLMREWCQKELGDAWNEHFVAITDEGPTLLRSIAEQDGVSVISMPKSVGGRFSVLTSVGILPASFLGIDCAELLRGATPNDEILAEASLWAAVQKEQFDAGNVITTLFTYGDRLLKMGEWYRQLLSESIGKNGVGPTPLLARGSTDQHSLVQLLRDGPKNHWTIFISETATNGNTIRLPQIEHEKFAYLRGKPVSEIFSALQQGTIQAFEKSGIPFGTLHIRSKNVYDLGRFILLAELQIGILGELFQVNPYDQPAVEDGKIFAKEILITS